MFTGLVQESVQILEVRKNLRGMELKIQFEDERFFSMAEGDSIALDGVCLTARDVELDLEFYTRAWFDVSEETLSKTHFRNLKTGDFLHAESSLKAGDPLGGHFVSGHVEGTATLTALDPQGAYLNAEITIDGSLYQAIGDYLIPKGSITLDGVSLTINDLHQSSNQARVQLTLIPETLQKTKWKHSKVGDEINVESDLFAKHVGVILKNILARSSSLAAPPPNLSQLNPEPQV